VTSFIAAFETTFVIKASTHRDFSYHVCVETSVSKGPASLWSNITSVWSPNIS